MLTLCRLAGVRSSSSYRQNSRLMEDMPSCSGGYSEGLEEERLIGSSDGVPQLRHWSQGGGGARR